MLPASVAASLIDNHLSLIFAALAQRDGHCKHTEARAHAESTIRTLLHDLLEQTAVAQPAQPAQFSTGEQCQAPERITAVQRFEQFSIAEKPCLAQCACCHMSYQQQQPQPECSPLSRSCYSTLSTTSSSPSLHHKGTRDRGSSFRGTSSQLSSAASTVQRGGWTARNSSASISSSLARRHSRVKSCASQMSLTRAAQEVATCRSPLSVTGKMLTSSTTNFV
jgi:hypothetical protein